MADAAKTVLVADDEALFREITVAALEDSGFVVTAAPDGRATIAALGARLPDLVLLDVNMPRLDGWGVLEYVRTMATPLRVVLMTGQHDLAPHGKLLQLVTGYLIKPFSVAHLLATCAAVLGRPTHDPAGERRREPRRTFAVEAVLLTDAGQPAGRGRLVQVSRHGFRVDAVTGVNPGDRVTAVFPIPGRAEPLRVTGQVRWCRNSALGASREPLPTAEEQLIEDLIGC